MPTRLAPDYEIYGDNILECERALYVLAQSLAKESIRITWIPSPLYAPCYEVSDERDTLFKAQLFPGYGRWPYNVQEHLRTLGAPLREATDAVMVRVISGGGAEQTRKPVLALEFCGALPAGNNAWQRCGRALVCAYAGVPYLYFAELGGAELDANRMEKASRLPNPLVPFAYTTIGQITKSLILPVFSPSPSISIEAAKVFQHCFGEVEAAAVVKELLTDGGSTQATDQLRAKTAAVTQILASLRKRKDTLVGNDWVALSQQPTALERVRWLLKKGMRWVKKAGIKRLTPTFKKLVASAIASGAVAVGSRDIPICLLGAVERKKFSALVSRLYGKRVTKDFLTWLGGREKPLVIAWVCGFKPRGDDSRPDRGLVPLARMLFGLGEVEYLTVVYGPASVSAWQRLQTDMWGLAQVNGLWEAVVGLSNAILVDSATAGSLKTIGLLVTQRPTTPRPSQATQTTSLSQALQEFSEHHVDSVLHTLFANASSSGVFEGMCNPPGGDWSGMSFQSSADGETVRWTSLPRVTSKGAKRPDHVVVFYGPPLVLLSVESKDAPRVVETGIGPRLTKYVEELLRVAPNVMRKVGEKLWGLYGGKWVSHDGQLLSGAAFRFQSKETTRAALARGGVDVVFAIEFLSGGNERVILHVVTRPEASWVGAKLKELSQRFSGKIEVQID